MLDTHRYDWQAGQPLHIDKASMWEPGRLLRGPALRSHRPHAEGLGRAEHCSWDGDRTQKAVVIRLVQAEMSFGRPVLRTTLL